MHTMRTIDQTLANHFWKDESKNSGSTTIYKDQDLVVMKLYNTKIAKKPQGDKQKVAINFGSYPTNTTFARINGIISYIGYELKKIKGTPTIINKNTNIKRIMNDNTRYTLQEIL